METFTTTMKFKPWQLRKINRCRIYLRAVTISDIATACGTIMNPKRWSKTNRTPVEASPYNWPLQRKPDKTAWKIWRNAIRTCLLQNKGLKLLATPLGAWTAAPAKHLNGSPNPTNSH
jgi:hypothetical protein